MRSESPTFLGGWASAKECAHGGPLFTDEMYSLTAFRSPAWAPGVFFAVGSYYNQSDPEGPVRCELLMSSNRGEAWTRLAPRTEFIPAGASWDSHTCCKPHRGPGLRIADRSDRALLTDSAAGLVDDAGDATSFYYVRRAAVNSLG